MERIKIFFTDYFDYFYKTIQIDNKVFDLIVNVKKQFNDAVYESFDIVSNKKKTIGLVTLYMENSDYIKKEVR